MTDYEIIERLNKIRDYAHECREAFEKEVIKDAFLRIHYLLGNIENNLQDKPEVEHE